MVIRPQVGYANIQLENGANTRLELTRLGGREEPVSYQVGLVRRRMG